MPTVTRRLFLSFSAAALIGITGANAPQLSAAEAGYEDAVLVDGELPAIEPGSFTIVVLPDTQMYAQHFPKTFDAQTEWIVKNKDSRNIIGALQLGDITNNNRVEEWKNAQHSMNILDGQVPYAISPGNHDFGKDGRTQDRTTYLNDFFPIEKFKQQKWFGGAYDKEPEQMENTFHLLKHGDRDLLILSLEFGPRKDVVRWANEVAGKHPKHEIILITHAYMYHDDTRYDWKKLGEKQKWNPHAYPYAKTNGDDIQDGEELWQNLVSKHENFILTINGHVLYDGLALLTSQTPQKRDVHQMLVNYQMRPQGGDGWLRLLEFQADGKTVKVYDYSPTRNQKNESTQNKFELKISPPQTK